MTNQKLPPMAERAMSPEVDQEARKLIALQEKTRREEAQMFLAELFLETLVQAEHERQAGTGTDSESPALGTAPDASV